VEDGRRFIGELVRDGFDVTAAFWVKTAEEGLRHLYVGSNFVDTESLGEAYQRAYACLRRVPDPGFGLSEIKLVPAGNPIVREAIAVRDRFAGRAPTRFRGERLGNLLIEEAYIYPKAMGPMTRHEVLQTVARLMDRSGVLQPSIVTLADGSTIQAIPNAMDMPSPGVVQIAFHDVYTGQDRVVLAEDVTNIQ
jgi:hypothetical protein